MMLLLQAEWLRFRRYRINAVVCGVLLVLLGASAWVAGTATASHRQGESIRSAEWRRYLDQVPAALPDQPESADAAKKAYEFGRGEAPPALRPAPGGLVLAVQQFRQQPFDVKVSIDSRHLDPRRGAPLTNPLLDSFGAPDFAVVVALLIPLAVTALCYGLVHDARELGVWRLIRAQMTAPLRLVAAGMLVRFAALLAIVWAASVLAFALDPGASVIHCLTWLAAVALYLLLWVLTAGLFNLARMSSAASALGMLALALVLNVVLPAWLARYAELRAPLPAREATVVEVRTIQHQADERMGVLLDAWYARHPEQRPHSVREHTWPVSYVPKTFWQDARIGALMNRFERARAAQAATLEPVLWLAPGLALCRLADRLAGADPLQYLEYATGIDRLEGRWRALLAPSVMNYRGLDAAQLREARRLTGLRPAPVAGAGHALAGLLASAALLAGAVLLLSRRRYRTTLI